LNPSAPVSPRPRRLPPLSRGPTPSFIPLPSSEPLARRFNEPCSSKFLSTAEPLLILDQLYPASLECADHKSRDSRSGEPAASRYNRAREVPRGRARVACTYEPEATPSLLGRPFQYAQDAALRGRLLSPHLEPSRRQEPPGGGDP